MAIDRNLQPHMQAYKGSVSNNYSRFILAATLQVMVAVVYYVAICAGALSSITFLLFCTDLPAQRQVTFRAVARVQRS